MFPSIDLNSISEDVTKDLKKEVPVLSLYRCFLYDFEKCDFVFSDGKIVEVTGKEALKVWIEKIIRTEKFKFKVYLKENKDEYGITIMNLLTGKKYPTGFLESELKREIKNALIKSPYIKDVYDFSINSYKYKAHIYFKVLLSDNSSIEQEVKL